MSFSGNTSSIPQVERRSEIRHTAYLPANLARKSLNSFATIINISESGLRIRTDTPFIRGDIVDVFLTSKQDNRIKIQVDVQACQKDNDEYYLGTKIISASETHALSYKEILESHKPTTIQ